MSAQFNIRAADPASVSLLESELGLPRFIAATLVARGIRTPHDAREFLNPSLERDWLDPYTIPGLPEVADALEEAKAYHDQVLPAMQALRAAADAAEGICGQDYWPLPSYSTMLFYV